LRWMSVVTISLLLLALGNVDGDIPGPAERAAITVAAGEHRFNLATWELAHLASLVSTRSPKDNGALIEYFELADVRRGQDQQLLKAVSKVVPLAAATAQETQRNRDRIADQMEVLELDAAAAIRSLVSEILVAEGLTTDLPGFGPRLLPPLSFTLEELPRVLVVSPRDRIELTETVVLLPGITNSEIESIENALARRNLSALVDHIGGMATYPSLIREDLSLRQAVSTIAHEWIHHYLFFRPLGQRYGVGNEMATINETLANIVGNEVAASYYREGPPSFTASLDPPEPAPRDGRFDVNRHLRETRERTDEFLVEGSVDEAESYMEERRLELLENGVFIRKLNQAFFAFRGTYADSPGSVSPVFQQLTLLRREEPTLKAFIAKVANIKSPEELAQLVARDPG
jgi:hypothetical protein